MLTLLVILCVILFVIVALATDLIVRQDRLIDSCLHELQEQAKKYEQLCRSQGGGGYKS